MANKLNYMKYSIHLILFLSFIFLSEDIHSKRFNNALFYQRYNSLESKNSRILYFLEGGYLNEYHEGYIAYLQKDSYVLEYYKWNNNTEKLIKKRVIKNSSNHIASIFESYSKNFDSLVLINDYNPLRRENDTINIDGNLFIKYNDIYQLNHYRFMHYHIKLDNEKILKNDLRVYIDIYTYNIACPDLGFILLTLNKLTVM